MKTKGSKILSTLVVLAMVLSTMVVLNKLDINIVNEASAAPGVTAWGYPTNVTTSGLKFGTSEVSIDINTTGLQIRNYYLYYPVYRNPYNLTWKPYKVGGVQKSITVHTVGLKETLEGITLNRSGIWVLNTTENTGVIKAHNAANWSLTAKKWFWVNSSETISMTVSPTEVLYGNNETITATAADSPNTWFDVRRKNNSEPDIKLAYNTTGVLRFSSNWKQTLKWAGNYSITAYRDLDDDMPSYQTLGYGYNRTFGSSPAITADYYSYSRCGPWDPPEYNASYQTIRVKSGVPKTSIPTANATMFWNRAGRVNITVKDYNTQNISKLRVLIYNSDEAQVNSNFSAANIITSTATKGWITIYHATWGKNATVWGENGTWYVYLYYDVDGDNATQAREYANEWNTTVEFTVGQAPAMQLIWVSDDGGVAPTQSATDEIIQAVPAKADAPLKLRFQLRDRAGDYFGVGATYTQAKENITLSGDALFLETPKTLDKYPLNVTFTGGTTWNVNVTPKMILNGGHITISAYWKDQGTVSSTINIGGDLSGTNGSVVTISPTEFNYGVNTTFTVTVKDPSGVPYSNAVVYLYWVNDSEANANKMGQLYGLLATKNGKGSNGEYTFTLNTTQLSKNQTKAGNPWNGKTIRGLRNISAYVNLNNVGYGYALAKMKPKSDLKVEVSKGTVMAGEKTKFYVNVSKIGADGNKTGYPKTTALQVAIFNETGDRVTLDAAFGSIRDTDLDEINNSINEYFLKPGTYTLHAYNNTDNSMYHNATFVVKAVDVTCDLSEFIWNVDKNKTATFTVKYNGNPVNGTLTLYNITDVGAYNKTWVNESGTGNDSISLTVTNGVAILNNITANYLPTGKAQMNVTFTFKPKTSGSDCAHTNGMVPVKIATVNVTPSSVPYNKPAALSILVSGRGTPLEDVFVSIVVPGLTGQMNTTTDSVGKATFAFTPPSTGYILIKVENRTSDKKVRVTAWSTYIVAVSQVNEGESFTVTVYNGTITGAVLSGVSVTLIGGAQTGTTDSTGKVTLIGPTVGSNGGTFTITATKEGYADSSQTITVNNVPKLTVILPSAKVYGTKDFVVTIADDAGSAIIGAKVTFNGADYYTGVGGSVTITAPDVKETSKDYPLTATFTGFESASPVTLKIYKTQGGIPGFELVTLIAAIGVALILLRRKRN